MTADDTTRTKVVKLLRRGVLTMSEAADLAGVSRQLVRYWCERDGVDYHEARRAFIERLWLKP